MQQNRGRQAERSFSARDFRFGRALLRRHRHGIVEIYDGGTAFAQRRLFKIQRRLFFLFLIFFRHLRRDSLLDDGLASADLRFFHSLSQIRRFAFFAPFLRASQQSSGQPLSSATFFQPRKQRAERKSHGEQKRGEQSGNRHQVRADGL